MDDMGLNALNHDEIRAWLARALDDREPLPRLTPDESPYLGILRLDKRVASTARTSLHSGALGLLREFCERPVHSLSYVRNLLSLAIGFRDPEVPKMLSDLALDKPKFLALPLDERYAVLSALVDAPPPRDAHFWQQILAQDPRHHAALSLAGAFTTLPIVALRMLRSMPNVERIGQSAAVNLDLAWDEAPRADRPKFVQTLQVALAGCGPHFAAPVLAWMRSVDIPVAAAEAHPTLLSALAKALAGDAYPRTSQSKLCGV